MLHRDTQVVLLAGGKGTRLREWTGDRPKPMVEVGGRPLLWHVMRTYAHHGLRRFVIGAGYRGDVIRDWLRTYRSHRRVVRFDLASAAMTPLAGETEDWEVLVVDDGAEIGSVGRLRGMAPYLDGPRFLYGYGDSVGDVDVDGLVAGHAAAGRLVTVTSVVATSGYGVVEGTGDRLERFREKPDVTHHRINGGYWVCERDLLDHLVGTDEDAVEITTLPGLIAAGRVGQHRHDGYWHSVDTYKDLLELRRRWVDDAPWAAWRRPEAARLAAVEGAGWPARRVG